jgi:hypothetical protein
MGTVSSLTSPVNGSPLTVEGALDWIKKAAEKHDISQATAQMQMTAIRQMAEQVAAGEPEGDLKHIVANIDKLRERWARRNQGNANTAKTYASRAKGAINEYLRWAAAPDKYDRKAKPAKAAQPKGKAAKTSTAVDPVQMPPPAPANAQVPEMQTCSLGGGRSLKYIAPSDGLKLKDAYRVAYQLIVNCEDYDPEMGTPAQVMSMVQRPDKS